MKDSVYRIVVDMWRLAARYGFRRMRDGEWEEFINGGDDLVMRYRKKGAAMERLCRDMLSAFQEFYQKMD